MHSLRSTLLLALLTGPCIVRSEPVWPFQGLADGSYPREHEHLVRRNVDAHQRLATQTPTGMRKMSGDPDEMFFLHYWQFEPSAVEAEGPAHFDNVTLVEERDLLPPLLLHTENQPFEWLGLRNLPRNIFQKRDFQCPNNTNACTSINRPNSCCGADETCMIIKDSGIGDVGCCPKGSSCGGSIGTCNTDQGYQSCPGSPNGGCCIPHYSCNGVGCAAGGTSTSVTVVITTVTVTPGGSTVTSTSTPPPPATTTSTVTPPPTTESITGPSTSTVYTTLPPSTTTAVVAPGTSTTNSSTTESSTETSTSTTSTSTTSTTSTTTTSVPATAAPPVRPTSQNGDMCPTGFYPCSAYYIGGCCQVGRNCDTTNCPSSRTQTITSDGATIIIPGVGAATTVSGSSGGGQVTPLDVTTTTAATSTARSGQSQCPNGWNICASAAGGGCCPTGYGCAAAACTATAGGSPNEVAKADASSGSSRLADSLGALMALAAAFFGTGMLLL